MNINKQTTQIILFPSNAKTIYIKSFTKILDFVITRNSKKAYVLYYSGKIFGFKLATLKEIGQIDVKLKEASQIKENKNQIAVSGLNSSTILIYDFKINCILCELRHYGIQIKYFSFHNETTSNNRKNSSDQLFYSLDFQNQLYIWTSQKGNLKAKVKLNQGLEKITIPQNISAQTLIQLLKKFQHLPNIFQFNQIQSTPLISNLRKNEKQQLTLAKNIDIKASSYGDKIIVFSLFKYKIIRQNKFIQDVEDASFINDFKWLVFTLKNRNVIIFDTSTFKFIKSIMNCYQYQNIKLSKRDKTIVVMAFNEFGLKIWNQQ